MVADQLAAALIVAQGGKAEPMPLEDRIDHLNKALEAPLEHKHHNNDDLEWRKAMGVA